MAKHFAFAWLDDEDEEFDPDIHGVEDEDVYAFDYEQSEGDFAGMKLTIKNPRIGFLNPGRPLWMIMSYNQGSQSVPDWVPFFKGRIIGVPTNIFDTLVEVDFVARPSDFEEQKAALAETLRVLPYWDPIFIKPENWDDPDSVLEARSVLWHIHPVTHVVSISDILIGDGTAETVTEDQHFYDGMQVTLNQTPLRSIKFAATIPWQQQAQGGVDLTPVIRSLNGGYIIESFTMPGLISDWPKPGSGFGSGWDVLTGSLTDISNTYDKIKIPDLFVWQGQVPVIPVGSIQFPLKVTGEYHSGEKAGFNFQYDIVVAAIGYAIPDLSVTFSRDASMAQVLTFTMQTDQQAIVTLPGEDESMIITLNANRVSDATRDGSIPIGSLKARDYLHTPRGIQSIEYCLLYCRAHLIARSRAVETTVEMGWVDGFRMLNLKKGALIQDHRLPGGEAAGKIIGVHASLNGEDGTAIIKPTIASCVGKGGSHTASDGTPSYVDDTLDDTQEYVDAVVLTDTADLAFTIPGFEPFDDGLDFINGLTASKVVLSAQMLKDASYQAGIIEAAGEGPNTDQAKISEVLKDNGTQFSIQMVPMETGPHIGEVVISLADLVIPQQINLEAPSNA